MREAHPTLYYWYITYAIVSIFLGINLLLTTPPFMPLEVPKVPVAIFKLVSGAILLGLLLRNSPRNLILYQTAFQVLVHFIWAGALSLDFILESRTSMQLPIYVTGYVAWGFGLLIEPFTNPATATAPKESNGHG